MSLPTITSNNHTFGQLVTVLAGLISLQNYLTDGPSFIANTQLTLTNPTLGLNVANSCVISGNLTVGNAISATTLRITQNGNITGLVTTNLHAQNVVSTFNANLVNIISGSINILDGILTLSTLNVSTLNATSTIVQSIQCSGGNVTLDTLLSSNATILSGVITVGSLLAQTANINTLVSNGAGFGISSNDITSTVTNSTISLSTISSPSGLTKNDVGLGNVDNTSDSTKNSATANLSNKTLMSPLIITGNISALPSLPLQIANKSYVDSTRANIGNPIINGNMDVWQRGNTFTGLGTGLNTRLADRWRIVNLSTEGVININRSNNVPSVNNAEFLCNSSLEIVVTTADAVVSSADVLYIGYFIEGYDWRPFAQRQFTLSFWVFSSTVGIHTVGFSNQKYDNADRHYIAEYTINSANTWEYKTITVPPSPADGTWNYTNRIGLEIGWALQAGSLQQTTPGVWSNVQFALSTSNVVNDLANTSNIFRLTGVKMELGPIATQSKFRSYDEELFLCKRYYQKSFASDIPPSTAAGRGIGDVTFIASKSGVVANYSSVIKFEPPMSSNSQTIILYSPVVNSGEVYNSTRSQNCSASAIYLNNERGFSINTTGSSATVLGDVLNAHWTADSELT